MAAAGWRLALADLDADKIREAIDFDPGSHLIQATDISDAAGVQSLFEQTKVQLGPLNAIANVAGLTMLEDSLLEDVSPETFAKVIDVNVRGTFMMCQHAVLALRESGGGAIINVGSVASILGTGGAAYVTSKHAMAGLTRHIAYRYAPENIRATLVAPGPTATPMIDLVRNKKGAPAVSGSAPGTIGRDATADEVASLIVYLMGDDAAMITGTVYAVDGGMSQH
ncbi:SDR family NAD(P)-dependent oxidoreductase [Aeromicrobium sp. UC242_57]|uniref:SDR family NAD(P)-dependent oxidoreductase n=1 Tax=Aeromicrobium sp. UC242_57 TaxID=3374624 RepID=UPI00378DDD85